jgi:hypothetical protein
MFYWVSAGEGISPVSLVHSAEPLKVALSIAVTRAMEAEIVPVHTNRAK